MSTYCKNPKCKESLEQVVNRGRSKSCGQMTIRTGKWFCPSCRYVGRRGMFLGGALVGIVAGLLKLAKVI